MTLNEDIATLTEEERKIKFLWEQVFPYIEKDKGLIWTDEIREKLSKLEKESERVLLTLRHLKSNYEFFIERFQENSKIIALIEELIEYIEHLQSGKQWIIKIHSDIEKLISDLDNIGKEYLLFEHHLNDRVRLLLKFYPNIPFRNIIYATGGGKIINCIGKFSPIFVDVGTGAILNKSCEIMTNRLSGCLAVFIFGSQANALLHMNPKDNLPFERPYLDNTVRYIMESITPVGNPKSFNVVILGNMYGNDRYKKRWEDWKAVENEFRQHGVDKIKIVEMPLEHTTLYHSNLDPDNIFVIGSAAYIEKSGELRIVNRIRVYRIPISHNKQVDFGISRA